MHYINLDDAEYAGSFSHIQAIPQSAKRARGKHKGNKREPRGLYGGYARRSRKAAVEARVTTPQPPQAMSYSDRLSKFGAVGRMDD